MTSRIRYNSPTPDGWFGLPYHYEMVADSSRVLPFRKALEQVCDGKIVLESGTGSGILSLIAASAGAKRVYTFEVDPDVGDVAVRNIERSGFRNIIYRQKDICSVTLADLDGLRPGVVIAENLSTWQVAEPEIAILNHINERLAGQGTIRIPSRIFNTLELAESQFSFEGLVDIRTCYFQFSGIQEPGILSGRILFEEVDLNKINRTLVRKSVIAEVTCDGILNSLRLTSPVQVYEDIMFEGSDSLMPPVVVPLREDLTVRAGDRVQIEISYEAGKDWPQFDCSATSVV